MAINNLRLESQKYRKYHVEGMLAPVADERVMCHNYSGEFSEETP